MPGRPAGRAAATPSIKRTEVLFRVQHTYASAANLLRLSLPVAMATVSAAAAAAAPPQTSWFISPAAAQPIHQILSADGMGIVRPARFGPGPVSVRSGFCHRRHRYFVGLVSSVNLLPTGVIHRNARLELGKFWFLTIPYYYLRQKGYVVAICVCGQNNSKSCRRILVWLWSTYVCEYNGILLEIHMDFIYTVTINSKRNALFPII